MRHRVTDHADTVAYADLVVIEQFHKTLCISVVRDWHETDQPGQSGDVR